MPVQIDPVTLVVTAVLMIPLIAAAMLFLWWQTREAALLFWAGGTLAMAASTLLIPGALDVGGSMRYGALLLLAGHWLFLQGICAFRGADTPARALRRYLLPVLLLAWLAAIPFDSLALSLTFGVYASAALALLCGSMLIFGPGRQGRAAAMFTGTIFVLEAVWLLLCASHGFSGGDVAEAWRWLHVGAFVLLIGWSFGFLMAFGQRNQERIAELANRDQLTGIATRRALLEQAEHALAMARRKQTPLALLMLDIDHFKQVNDAHGHAAGDLVLRHFAATVDGCLRSTDLFGRVGGEEFCILLSDTPGEGARLLAERVRSACAAARVMYRGIAIDTTVSIGLAHIDDGRAELADLMASADQALYQAKRAGRNQVCCVERSATAGSIIRLVWDGRYRCGHAMIDGEHEYLFGRVNALFEEMQKAADSPGVEARLREVLFWLVSHFRHEEEILAAAGWPELARHARLHGELEARGAALLEDVQAGRRNHAALLDFLLIDIIARHLAQDDAEYFAFVQPA